MKRVRRRFKTRMAAWDAEHMRTCSCRLTKDDYELFRHICRSNGVTVHAAVRLMVGRFLMALGAPLTDGLEQDVERDRRLLAEHARSNAGES